MIGVQFEVRALAPGGGVVSLTVEAIDRAGAESEARRRGLLVIGASAKAGGARLAFTRRARFDLLLFSHELLALLAAGLNLVEALDALALKAGDSDAGRILQSLLVSLREGRAFSRALAQHPASFPALYVATVQAAERSGDLPEALRRYIGYREQMDLVRKKLVSASIYPVLLLAAGGLVTLFLLGYVVPKFSGIYADSGRDLPWLSQVLLGWGLAVERNAGAMLALLGAAVLLTGFVLLRARGWVMRVAWKLPAIGERLLIYELARFYRTLGMLLRGGTPIVTALDMCAGLLAPALRPGLAAARTRIREGAAISVAMAASGLTTPIAERMLHVGERTGEMAEMMDRIANFCDDTLARWVEWATRLFEPLLMAFIGLVIGAIVVLMYLPIFELAGSLQ